jgi:hypothetical protein
MVSLASLSSRLAAMALFGIVLVSLITISSALVHINPLSSTVWDMDCDSITCSDIAPCSLPAFSGSPSTLTATQTCEIYFTGSTMQPQVALVYEGSHEIILSSSENFNFAKFEIEALASILLFSHASMNFTTLYTRTVGLEFAFSTINGNVEDDEAGVRFYGFDHLHINDSTFNWGEEAFELSSDGSPSFIFNRANMIFGGFDAGSLSTNFLNASTTVIDSYLYLGNENYALFAKADMTVLISYSSIFFAGQSLLGPLEQGTFHALHSNFTSVNINGLRSIVYSVDASRSIHFDGCIFNGTEQLVNTFELSTIRDSIFISSFPTDPSSIASTTVSFDNVTFCNMNEEQSGALLKLYDYDQQGVVFYLKDLTFFTDDVVASPGIKLAYATVNIAAPFALPGIVIENQCHLSSDYGVTFAGDIVQEVFKKKKKKDDLSSQNVFTIRGYEPTFQSINIDAVHVIINDSIAAIHYEITQINHGIVAENGGLLNFSAATDIVLHFPPSFHPTTEDTYLLISGSAHSPNHVTDSLGLYTFNMSYTNQSGYGLSHFNFVAVQCNAGCPPANYDGLCFNPNFCPCKPEWIGELCTTAVLPPMEPESVSPPTAEPISLPAGNPSNPSNPPSAPIGSAHSSYEVSLFASLMVAMVLALVF